MKWVCWQAHSCVEKAGMISLVKVRELDVDDDFSLRGTTLQKAIEVRHSLIFRSCICCILLLQQMDKQHESNKTVY